MLPQTVRRILPVYKGEFISLVKMTSIVGYIAVQDLTKASDIIRSRTFDAFFPLIMVAVLYFAISWVLMQSLEHLERITDPKYRRRKAVTRMIRVEHLSKSFGELDRAEGHHHRDPEGRSGLDHRPVGHRQEHVPALPQSARTARRGGSIHIDGIDMLDRKTNVAKMRQRMNMVFQSFNLFAHLSVLENLTLAPIKLRGHGQADGRRRRRMDLLKLVGLAEKARQLSRTSSPAARSSASRSPAAWRWTRRSSSSTSRPRRSIPTMVSEVLVGDPPPGPGRHDDGDRHPRDGFRARRFHPRLLHGRGPHLRGGHAGADLRQSRRSRRRKRSFTGSAATTTASPRPTSICTRMNAEIEAFCEKQILPKKTRHDLLLLVEELLILFRPQLGLDEPRSDNRVFARRPGAWKSSARATGALGNPLEEEARPTIWA